jgi:hypothetical protein
MRGLFWTVILIGAVLVSVSLLSYYLIRSLAG